MIGRLTGLQKAIYENNNKVPKNTLGQYWQFVGLYHNVALNNKMCKYVRDKAFVKVSDNVAILSVG